VRGPHLPLAVFLAGLCLASASRADDPYADFRVPEARSFSWVVSGLTRWRAQETGEPDVHAVSRFKSGYASSTLHRHAESDRYASDLRGAMSGQWSSFLDHAVFTDGESEFFRHRSDDDFYDAFASVEETRFVRSTNWGVDIGLTGSYSFERQGRAFQAIRNQATFSEAEGEGTDLRSYFGTGNASLGLGYGRVRDATGVFDAQVLAQRLAATGRLRHAPSAAALQRLAQLFAVRFDLGAAHDRSERYFWREVERILREDDSLVDGTFDAFSLIRALEPATLKFAFTRRAGWRVSTSYMGSRTWGHSDFDRWQERNGTGVFEFHERSSDRIPRNARAGQLLVDAEYQRPLGMRLQMSARSTTGYGDGSRRLATVTSALEFDHLVADRWLVSVALAQRVESSRQGSVRVHPDWNVSAIAQAQFFVEDSWALFAVYRHAQARHPVFSYFSREDESQFDRTSDLQAGITFHAGGRFEAPGLGISERLTRGAF